jgi:hypothetical protein
MACSVTFTCDACGAIGQGIPGDYTCPDPPRGWTWFWGSPLKMTGPHACSPTCWGKVSRSPDGKLYLPDSHERRDARDEELKMRAMARSELATFAPLPPPAALPSLVYFIQRGEDGPVKIGHSKNVRGRLSALQTGIPERLRVLGVLDGGKAEEQRLHRYFGAYCIQGEWFKPVPELLAYIRMHGRAA